MKTKYKKTITVCTQGVTGGDSKTTKQALCIIDNVAENYKISVDCYEGSGLTYKPREKAEIVVTTPNYGTFRLTIAELQSLLWKHSKNTDNK